MSVIEKAKEQLQKNSETIYFSRIPQPTKREFIEIALNEFSDDYGMAFTHIFHEWKLLKQLMTEVVLDHEKRIQALEQPISEDKPVTIRLLSGKELIKNGQTSNG
jgi:hypothetical protein